MNYEMVPRGDASDKAVVGRVVLSASDLSFSYSPQAPRILKGWSAEFRSGTVTAITGPSGRGKSTLLYLLGLMLQPSSGEVCVDGVPADSLPDRDRARLRAARYGFVFQDAALDATRTVLDNVTETSLYRGANRFGESERALSLLNRFGVSVPPTRKPGQVSGGQAQRIALCRALLSDPDILLADEPTGNLDPESANTVVNGLIDHARAGAAVVVVTHSPAVVDACDEVILL